MKAFVSLLLMAFAASGHDDKETVEVKKLVSPIVEKYIRNQQVPLAMANMLDEFTQEVGKGVLGYYGLEGENPACRHCIGMIGKDNQQRPSAYFYLKSVKSFGKPGEKKYENFVALSVGELMVHKRVIDRQELAVKKLDRATEEASAWGIALREFGLPMMAGKFTFPKFVEQACQQLRELDGDYNNKFWVEAWKKTVRGQ